MKLAFIILLIATALTGYGQEVYVKCFDPVEEILQITISSSPKSITITKKSGNYETLITEIYSTKLIENENDVTTLIYDCFLIEVRFISRKGIWEHCIINDTPYKVLSFKQ